MTTIELHTILNDENKKLSLAELKQVVYELRQDCLKEQRILLDKFSRNEMGKETYINQNGYSSGEQNAFQIVLDLLEHLEV